MGGIRDTDRWPWSWHRVISYVTQVRGVYERAAYDAEKSTAVPPRWMFWDAAALDDWFESRRKAQGK